MAIDDEATFNEKFNAGFEERMKPLQRTLDIVVIGRVCTGKSSLLNAFLQKKPDDPSCFRVGAISGSTKELRWHALTERVRVADAPGLDDVIEANAQVTEDHLGKVDVGIFVVAGSSDKSQRDACERLRGHSRKIFVVLNKIDQYDEQNNFEEVVEQWREALGVSQIFCTTTKGYDPNRKAGAPMDIRGVDELRNAVNAYLVTEGLEHLLSAAMADKNAVVQKIIASTCVAVALEAFLPGSMVYISASQAAAIAAIYHQYTGKVLTRSQALAVLPVFAAQSVGTSLFLFAKSLLPPTGIVDAAAAVVALTVTLAMLLAVNKLLASGATLENRDQLAAAFVSLRSQAQSLMGQSRAEDWKSQAFWAGLVRKLMYL
jgi:small GTP-binding protein